MMPMPEAAVDKYGNFLATQNNIRASRQILTILLLVVTKGANKTVYGALWSCIPRLDSPHDTAAFGCGECVHSDGSLVYPTTQFNPYHKCLRWPGALAYERF